MGRSEKIPTQVYSCRCAVGNLQEYKRTLRGCGWAPTASYIRSHRRGNKGTTTGSRGAVGGIGVQLCPQELNLRREMHSPITYSHTKGTDSVFSRGRGSVFFIGGKE